MNGTVFQWLFRRNFNKDHKYGFSSRMGALMRLGLFHQVVTVRLECLQPWAYLKLVKLLPRAEGSGTTI